MISTNTNDNHPILRLGNGITSAVEPKPFMQTRVKKKPANKKKCRSTKKPGEHSSEVLELRKLLGGKKRITVAGKEATKRKRLDEFEKAFGIEVVWVRCTKRLSEQTFIEQVIQTKPDLVIILLHGTGKMFSRHLKRECKSHNIPSVMMHTCGGVNFVAHEILNQARNYLQKNNRKD